MSAQAEIKQQLAACSSIAGNCKGNADYASYSFSQGDETNGRMYVAHLRENVARLEYALSRLDRLKKKAEVAS